MIAARSLDSILGSMTDAARRQGIRKSDLSFGDWVIVTTRNSSYSIISLGEGQYCVAGGWFDRQGVSPARTTINGCTWGGSTIKTDLVAGNGLFLEFGNRVLTTRIQKVRLIRSGGPNLMN